MIENQIAAVFGWLACHTMKHTLNMALHNVHTGITLDSGFEITLYTHDPVNLPRLFVVLTHGEPASRAGAGRNAITAYIAVSAALSRAARHRHTVVALFAVLLIFQYYSADLGTRGA